jgi:TPR repeat protein
MHEENMTKELEKLKISAIDCYLNEQFEALPKILRSMIELGSAWALHYLAGCYTYGHGVETDIEEANRLHLEAANLGFSDAQMTIGNHLLSGHGVEKDVEKGIYFLRLSSDQGNGYASFLLGNFFFIAGEQDAEKYPEAIRYFRKGADQGDHRAMQCLAWALSNGRVVEKNEEEALSLNVNAADLGNQTAAYNAAGAFRYGHGTPTDCNKAISYYEIAANFGMMEAMHNLGTIYFNAEGITKDIEKANHWYLKAANLGSGLSSLCLGLISEQGTRGPADNAFAFAWFSVAAAQGNIEAQKKIESLSKTLIDEEIKRAIFLLNAFCERGFPWAQQALGSIYFSGELVAPDGPLAFKWLSAAAEQNLATAQGYLARAHEMGIGTEKNIEQAFELYKLSSTRMVPPITNKPTYNNWLAKTLECGLTNEQACGLAMLYAWTLARKDSTEETVDTEAFWTFIDQKDFDEIKKNTFSLEDFWRFLPELKTAGELLKVKMPDSRIDASGEPATLLDMQWQAEPLEGLDNIDVLCLHHRFDMLWCQRVGECLRREIRTPLHAYVFADYIAEGFRELDPEGFARILDKLLHRRSPLVRIFSDKYLVKSTNGFEGHEPFHLALIGFMAGQDNRLGELLWNIQRVLFYSQPSGAPVNLDKQCLGLDDFVVFATPLVTTFVNNNKPSHLNVSALISTEYLLQSADKYQPLTQLYSLMQDRYGFPLDNSAESLSLRLLVNAAAFFTISCLHIKNLTNQIARLPTLRMLDTEGLLWTRDVEGHQPLLNEAIDCFNIMLSWRLGPAQALFLETENGLIQRAYIGEESKLEDILAVFSKICTAYKPFRCVIAYMVQDDPSPVIDPINTQVVFLSLGRDASFELKFFRTDANVEHGQFLGAHIRTSDDANLLSDLLNKFREDFSSSLDYEKVAQARAELLDLFPSPLAWQFSTSFEDEMSNPTSQDFRLDISGIERGYLWPFSRFLIQKLKIDVISLESILCVDSSAEKIWFDKYVALQDLGQVDRETSVQQQKLSADIGNPFEQNNYAVHLSTLSHEESRDSVQYFLAAAHQSLPYAQVTLGWYLLHGLGGMERNVKKAFEWNMKGAIQGHPEGASNVAFQYENGIGVAPNLELAKHWYSYATIRGSVIGYGHLTYLTREENEK